MFPTRKQQIPSYLWSISRIWACLVLLSLFFIILLLLLLFLLLALLFCYYYYYFQCSLVDYVGWNHLCACFIAFEPRIRVGSWIGLGSERRHI